MAETKVDRRSFVKAAACSLAAIPIVTSAEAEKPKLPEDDPQAAALGYKEDSTQVDKAKYPNHEPTQLCDGCALYTTSSDEWGDCSIFPGKLVAAKGWCAAFAPKPS